MKCPICSEGCHPFTDEKLYMRYCHCRACHFIFKSPDHYQAYDEQKKRYDLHQNEESSEGYQAYFKRFMDYILPLTGNPKSALDFGCGATSLLAKMMREEGIDCDFYDPVYHPETLRGLLILSEDTLDVRVLTRNRERSIIIPPCN